VGEGIIKHRLHTEPGPQDVSKWKEFASRCLLYRAEPPLNPPGSYSGLVLYAEEVENGDSSKEENIKGKQKDEVKGPGVVGFQSFVQMTSHNTMFELEGPGLDTRMQNGYVAFYGAFQVPDLLREEYRIQ